jgi:hypothetical protein
VITYFKSRQPSYPAVYVEDDEGWELYASGGIIQRNEGTLPSYLRLSAEELPFEEVAELIRLCEAEADLLAREHALRPPEPMGVGGWLVLPIIGLCITALWALVDITRYLPTMWRAWDVFTDPASDAYHPLWGPYIGFSTFLQFFLLLAPIFLLWLINKKKRVLPAIIVGYYVAVLFILLIDFVAVATFFSEWMADLGRADEVSTEVFRAASSVFRGIIFCGIWIPYFLLSSRVRATFTRPWSGRRMSMEQGARRSAIAALAAQQRMQWEQGTADQPQGLPTDVSLSLPSYSLREPFISGRRRWILLIPVVAVLVLVAGLVFGVAVWRGENPAQAKNPVTVNTDVYGNTTKHYSNKDFRFSFDYPSGWTIKDDSTADAQGEHQVSVYDPMGETMDGLAMDSALISASSVPDATLTVDEMKTRIKAGAKDGAAAEGLEVISDAADVTVNGMPGLYTLWRSTESNGDHILVPIYWLWSGGRLYSLTFNYSDRPSDSAKGDLDAILASFKATP